MNEQVFTVMGIPKGQARSRSRHIKTKAGKEFNTNYDPKESKENKSNIRAQVVAQRPKMLTPDVGALFIEVHAFMPRPKSHYRTNKGVSVLRIDAPLYHTSRPDADNILKAVKDALSGVCWIDDAQVSYAVIRKTYGNEPKMIITFGALIAMSAWWG